MSSDYNEAGQPNPGSDDPTIKTGRVPGSTPRSVGNLGSTADPSDEFDQPRSIGNPGSTPHSSDEYDQPRAAGNPGPHE